MWLGLLIAALVLLCLVFALLALPVRFDLEVHSEATRPVRVHVRALLGALTRELTSGKPRPPSPRASRGGGTRGARRAWAFLRSHGSLRRIEGFLARLLRALHVRELSGDARIGLDDPADTGELWALLAPLSLWLVQHPHQLVITPDFDEPALDVNGQLSVELVPLEVVVVTLGFLFSATTLRAAAHAWRTP